MEWFERWFGEEYILVYEHRNSASAEKEIQDIDNIIVFGENERVLDVCCGPGRHDNPIARFGCKIIGIDYSMPLLRLAVSCIPSGMKYPQYVRGDVRKMPFKEGSFDIVLNLFTSFGYFKDDENFELLKTMGRLLKTGGRFLIDYINPEKVLSNLVPQSVKTKAGIEIIENRSYDEESKRLIKKIIMTKDNDTKTFVESVRLYNLDEMQKMITDAGLTTVDVFGSMELESYNEESDRMVIFGIKDVEH